MPRSKQSADDARNGAGTRAQTKGRRKGAGPSKPTPRPKRAESVATANALREVQQLLTDLTRQAQEARAEVRSLSEERAEMASELAATAGRIGEAVRHARDEFADVVQQVREARKDVEELRRQARGTHRDGPGEQTGKPAD